MTITLDQVGRRFNQDWIFRNLDHQFNPGERHAILGPNGSGKSTLISILLGTLTPSAGMIRYHDGPLIEPEVVYKRLSFAAPYLDLIEEFTLEETIEFHFRFKTISKNLSSAEIFDILGLSKARDKALKYFSSGMKQRTKLVLACCADTATLVLDEPTSNLDRQGIAWYHELIEKYASDKLLIIGSNQEEEYSFCNHILQITNYK